MAGCESGMRIRPETVSGSAWGCQMVSVRRGAAHGTIGDTPLVGLRDLKRFFSRTRTGNPERKREHPGEGYPLRITLSRIREDVGCGRRRALLFGNCAFRTGRLIGSAKAGGRQIRGRVRGQGEYSLRPGDVLFDQGDQLSGDADFSVGKTRDRLTGRIDHLDTVFQ